MEKIFFGLILFAIGIIIYIFYVLLVCGHLFDLAPDYDIEPEFHEKYLQFWKNMTSYSRLILTKTYYTFYHKLSEELKSIIKKNKNPKINFEISENIGDFSRSNIHHTNVPFIIVWINFVCYRNYYIYILLFNSLWVFIRFSS